MKILIVEDDDAQLSFFAKELESRGFEVVTAQSGDEALYAYKKHGPFAFVLCDYRSFPVRRLAMGYNS